MKRSGPAVREALFELFVASRVARGGGEHASAPPVSGWFVRGDVEDEDEDDVDRPVPTESGEVPIEDDALLLVCVKVARGAR